MSRTRICSYLPHSSARDTPLCKLFSCPGGHNLLFCHRFLPSTCLFLMSRTYICGYLPHSSASNNPLRKLFTCQIANIIPPCHKIKLVKGFCASLLPVNQPISFLPAINFGSGKFLVQAFYLSICHKPSSPP